MVDFHPPKFRQFVVNSRKYATFKGFWRSPIVYSLYAMIWNRFQFNLSVIELLNQSGWAYTDEIAKLAYSSANFFVNIEVLCGFLL